MCDLYILFHDVCKRRSNERIAFTLCKMNLIKWIRKTWLCMGRTNHTNTRSKTLSKSKPQLACIVQFTVVSERQSLPLFVNCRRNVTVIWYIRTTFFFISAWYLLRANTQTLTFLYICVHCVAINGGISWMDTKRVPNLHILFTSVIKFV